MTNDQEARSLRLVIGYWPLVILWSLGFGHWSFAQERIPTAEHRAVAFLAREVPRWKAENKCYSCHNNGDGARALFAAMRHKQAVPAKGIEDTLAFLTRPDDWDKNGPEGPFKDKKLARIQFASALTAAADAGVVKDARPLARAAELVAELQHANGSFPIEGADQLGSPVTYGLCLSTSLARRTLAQADAERYRTPIDRADAWLTNAKCESVLDAAAILLGLPATEKHAAQRERCMALIRRGQSIDGGWGPYATSPPEPFDTALVLLALAREPNEEWKPAIRKGREFLIKSQQADGSWPETTRPAGAESYAQRVSTTSWAAMTLLETRAVELPKGR